MLGDAVRYVVVAGCGYLLALALYAAQIALGVPPYAAIITTFVLNGIFNFVFARAWAFAPSGRRVTSEARRFAAVAVVSLVVNYASFAVLYSVLGLPPLLAQALAIAIAAPLGFGANRLWSFRPS